VNVHASVGAGDLRHLLVLDEVDGRKHVSQRTLARRLGLPASLVNRLIVAVAVNPAKQSRFTIEERVAIDESSRALYLMRSRL